MNWSQHFAQANNKVEFGVDMAAMAQPAKSGTDLRPALIFTAVVGGFVAYAAFSKPRRRR